MLLSLISIASLDSAELKFNQKFINSTKKNLTIKLEPVEAFALYKALLQIPIEANNLYANHIRNLLIEQIDYSIDIFQMHLIRRFCTKNKIPNSIESI